MTAFKDLTGKRFGRLLALSPTNERKSGKVVWRCRCDCGEFTDVSSDNLLSGHTASCGCLRSESLAQRARSRSGDKNPNFKDLTGQRFNKLVVLGLADERQNGRIMWRCQCDCGGVVEVRPDCLLSGRTKSCGCLKLDLSHLRVGPQHPRWVADRSLMKQRDRVETRQLSRKCFERDGFACLFCGERGGKLQAHHLYNWKDHPERRFDLDNLVTLCRDCHKQFHHLYGVKNNSAVQFYEWIGAI